MSKTKRIMTTLIVIIVALTIGTLSIKVYSISLENQAVKIAQTYLAQKYKQTMVFDHVRHVWIDPGLYHIYFKPDSDSNISFEVLVSPDLSIRADLWQFGQSDWSADNYLIKCFERGMQEYLITDVQRLWGSDAAVKVLKQNISSGVFWCPSKLNENLPFSEMEPLIKYYWIYVDMHITKLDDGMLNLTAARIFDFIQLIQNNGYEPNAIDFWSSTCESESIVFKNWAEIVSVDQVIEQLRLEMDRN